MKILFITNHRQIAKESGGYINDYLNDLVFHGFYELRETGLIEEIVDSTPILPLYKENKALIPPQNIWGGFSSCWLIAKDDICRENLSEKISDRYFDLIIFGCIRRCQDFFKLVHNVYSSQEIIYLDGADDSEVLPLFKQGNYFKRELITENSWIKPISFSIPQEKICNRLITQKSQEFGTVIPGQRETYIFDKEEDYYHDYQQSYYGFTSKKAGWDCMRHYEILANSCIPYFADLEDCPKQCLFSFPKEAIQSAMYLADWEFNEDQYFEILDYLFRYTKENLTTKAIAQYILNSI